MTARSHSHIYALEERAFNACPALQTVLMDGWLLRFTDGYDKRANSANALNPMEAFADIRTTIELMYLQQGLPPIFRLTPLAGPEPDTVLADAGYQFVDEMVVMTLALSNTLTDKASDPIITIHPTLSHAWCDGVATFTNVIKSHRATHDQMLATIRAPCGFAVLEDHGAPVAYGLAVAERGMVGLFDIVTDLTIRRRGHGRRLVNALLEWGKTQGATMAYLQVAATNQAAIALYSALEFREAYRYHYRIRQQFGLA